MVTNGLSILGVLMGSQDFVMHFLDGVLSQNVAHIDDLLFLKDAHVALGILSSCVGHRFPYPTWTLPLLLLSCFFW